MFFQTKSRFFALALMNFLWNAAVSIIFGIVVANAPNSHSQDSSKTMGYALRAALLSGKGVEGEADLLTAELPLRMDGLALLERADLALILAEGSLISGKLPASLESADVLILVETIKVNEVAYLATRLVGRDDGRVHSSDLRVLHLVDEKWAGEIANLLQDFARAGPINEHETTVSVRVVREDYSAGKNEDGLVSVALTRLIYAELSNARHVRLLERSDLSLVQFERFLTRIDGSSFEEADRTVSGTFRSKDGSTRFELRVETPGTSEVERSEGVVPSENLGEIAVAMASKLASLLPLAKDDHAESNTSSVPPGVLSLDESGRFGVEAERAVRLGLHENAAKFAETALFLDPGEGFESLYLLTCAEFFAAFPVLHGRGINLDGEISAGRRDSGGSDLLLYIDMLPDKDPDGLPPLPGKEQWSALAAAVQRISDLDRRTLPMEEGQKNAARTKLSFFTQVVSRVTREAVLNGFTVFGNEPPPFERQQLERIATGSSQLFFPIPDILILESSPEEAVEQIHEWMFGAEIAALKEDADRDFDQKWRHVFESRHNLFAYFEHLGYDERTDRGSSVVDERILKRPFVALLSNKPATFEEVFSRALATAEAGQGLLALVDAQFKDAGSARSATERANEFVELRHIIRDNLEELKAIGMLEIYAVIQAEWERSRFADSTDEDASNYWQSLHTALYADDGWVSGRLTDAIIRLFDGRVQLSEKGRESRRRRDFLAALREDVSANGNAFGVSTRQVTLLNLDSKLKELEREEMANTGSPVTDVNADHLPGEIPDPDTIELNYTSFGSNLQTLATQVADDGIFAFQLGSASEGNGSQILKFNLEGKIDKLPVPDEVQDLIHDSLDAVTLAKVGRAGGLRVSSEHIEIVFPGGMATYDRATRNWKVTPVAFLRNRHAASFVGDQIISYTGTVRNLPAPPVQGIYLTDPTTMTHTALIDTSRVPPLYHLDESTRLEFIGGPLAFNKNRIVFGMRGATQGEVAFQFTLNTELDTSEKRPFSIPFHPGRNSKMHVSGANGFVTMVATRPPKALNDIYIENGGRMHVGAFAIDELGTFHWLLDSGTFPAIGALPSGGNAESERKMLVLPLIEKPLFQFPAAFSAPPGRFSQLSEALSLNFGPHFLKPVVHFNGERLLLLSDELTEDGRRLLYVWRNKEEIPKRFAIRFAGFGWVEGLDEEEIAEWNRNARNTVLSIFEWRDRLVFEYNRGFFSVPKVEFEQYLKW